MPPVCEAFLFRTSFLIVTAIVVEVNRPAIISQFDKLRSSLGLNKRGCTMTAAVFHPFGAVDLPQRCRRVRRRERAHNSIRILWSGDALRSN